MNIKRPPVPKHLPDYLTDLWREVCDQVKPTTPPSAIEAIARQIHLLRDAEARVTTEGAVVVDAKGNASEHPAIKIQREAGKELREWLSRYAATTPSWARA